jgi:hypothetical protein
MFITKIFLKKYCFLKINDKCHCGQDIHQNNEKKRKKQNMKKEKGKRNKEQGRKKRKKEKRKKILFLDRAPHLDFCHSGASCRL